MKRLATYLIFLFACVTLASAQGKNPQIPEYIYQSRIGYLVLGQLSYGDICKDRFLAYHREVSYRASLVIAGIFGSLDLLGRFSRLRQRAP